MSKRFKNMVLMGMLASLVLIPVSVTRAADLPETEYEEEMRERVFEEVLTGEITNDEDVIKVALAQYQERMNRRARMGSPEQAEDDGSLSITQVLDTYTDENGNVIEEVVTTGLIVMDMVSYENFGGRSCRSIVNAGSKCMILMIVFTVLCGCSEKEDKDVLVFPETTWGMNIQETLDRYEITREDTRNYMEGGRGTAFILYAKCVGKSEKNIW